MVNKVKTAKLALVGIGSLALLSLLGNVAFGLGGRTGQPEGKEAAKVYQVVEQAPLTADGKIASNVDKGYFANPEKGEVARIYVQNGQMVKKGDPLFDYVDTSNQTKDTIADLEEEQTNLYNQRVRLIRQRKKLTGKDYNYAGYPLDGSVVYGKGDSGADGLPDMDNEATGQTESVAGDASAGTSEATNGSSANGSTSESVEPSGKIDYSIPSTGDPAIDQVNSGIKEIEKKLLRAKRDQKPMVLADYNGVVYVNEDGLYNPQTPLVRLVTKDLVINSSISEYDYAQLKRDKTVKIYIKAEDRTVKGHVSAVDDLPNNMPTINSSASQQSQQGPGQGGGGVDPSASATNATTYGFQVVPEGKVHIGYSVSLEIPVHGFDVPATAILKKGRQHYVMKVVKGRVEKVPIEIEKRGLNRVVTGGLKKGDRIVIEAKTVKVGDRITANSSSVKGGKTHDSSH